MNTLPKAPSSVASRAISAKYSQSRPAAVSGVHRAADRTVNMPPRITTISTANSTM